MKFEIIPAIDILEGKCVRLEKGDYKKVKIYSENPIDIAKKLEQQNFKRIHIIDLDGAKFGAPKNIKIIKSIASQISIPVQVGGGIRSLDIIKEFLDSKIDRVILGTIAFENLSILKSALELFQEKIAVAIDAKNNVILTKGWLNITKLDAISSAKKLVEMGVKRFIYTDVLRDGMMKGPNFNAILRFAKSVDAKIIASGGVSSQADIQKLSNLHKNIDGCIVGKAFYEGKISQV